MFARGSLAVKFFSDPFIRGLIKVYDTVLDTASHGIPQHRERLYIVGIDKSIMETKFAWPKPVAPKPIEEILDMDVKGRKHAMPTSATAIDNLRHAYTVLIGEGTNPLKKTYVLDTGTSSQFMKACNRRLPHRTVSRDIAKNVPNTFFGSFQKTFQRR
jgi:site-specific DNA-cytosine methylase